MSATVFSLLRSSARMPRTSAPVPAAADARGQHLAFDQRDAPAFTPGDAAEALGQIAA